MARELSQMNGAWTWAKPALSFDLWFIILGHAFILALQWYWGVLIANGLYKAVAAIFSGTDVPDHVEDKKKSE